MTKREPNLRFFPNDVKRVQNLLVACVADSRGFPSVDEMYAEMVALFLNYGRVQTGRVPSGGASWWRYVPTDLQQ